MAFAAAALAGCNRSHPAKPPQDNGVAAGEAGLTKGADRSHKGTAAPDVALVNGDGEQTSLAEIAHGKPLLVNLWASWCAPCVKELPTLDRLSQAPNVGVQVAAISQDMGPHASVEAFLASHKITNLEAYQDKAMALSGALKAEVLPTSVSVRCERPRGMALRGRSRLDEPAGRQAARRSQVLSLQRTFVSGAGALGGRYA